MNKTHMQVFRTFPFFFFLMQHFVQFWVFSYIFEPHLSRKVTGFSIFMRSSGIYKVQSCEQFNLDFVEVATVAKSGAKSAKIKRYLIYCGYTFSSYLVAPSLLSFEMKSSTFYLNCLSRNLLLQISAVQTDLCK